MQGRISTKSASTFRRYGPFALVTAVIGLALFASATPSPLYETYRELWDLSPVVLTLVYALYPVGVLASLLVAGRVSDDIGRRPVLLVALGSLLIATVLFMVADSVVLLFAARSLQGLATGLALGAAGAAMLDLQPRNDASAVGLANGVVSSTGLALGVLFSTLIVQLLPAPRVLPYVLLFVLFALAFAGAVALREPVTDRHPLRLAVQRPRVPRAVRRPFIGAALAVMAAWSVAGMFLVLGPRLSVELFETSNVIVAGIPFFAFFATGAIAQLLTRGSPSWAAACGGALALFTGVVAIVAATSLGSAPLFLAGAIVAGAGFGVAFLGALRTLSAAIPADHRAAVMAAFYVAAYASLSLPQITAGVLVTPVGLETTFELFGGVVALVALAVAYEAWRTRPPTAALPAASPSI